MSRAEKHEQAWRKGDRSQVREPDMLLVLEENGFTCRRDGDNHWLAEHPRLRDHPRFSLPGGKIGRIRINCHAQGKSGRVHPFAVLDVLKALDYLRKKDGNEKEQDE